MKKIITALATVAFAIGVQAAQFDWSYDACGEFEDGSLVYVFSGADGIGATIAALLSADGTDGAKAFNDMLAANTYNASSATIEIGVADGRAFGVDASDYATVFVFQDGVVGGKEFAYYEGVEAVDAIYTPPSGASALELWGDDSYSTGKIAAVDAPEPTSGLLLLLGMAGLALKRKQK